jgi:CheY-like chemotaxis protein
MNLLIVDDLGTNRKLLRAQLEAEGHAILEAGDGVEALAVLECESVHAIISDIIMPNLDGYAFCEAVRKHAVHGATPFVFYSSTSTSTAALELAQGVGANRHLTKPTPMPVLLSLLRDLLLHSTSPIIAEKPLGSP